MKKVTLVMGIIAVILAIVAVWAAVVGYKWALYLTVAALLISAGTSFWNYKNQSITEKKKDDNNKERNEE